MDTIFFLAQLLISLYIVSKVGTEWAENLAVAVGFEAHVGLAKLVAAILLFFLIFSFSTYLVWGMLILLVIFILK